ncbi:hypothetical protein ACF0H5_022301 [Mactra antiquata]
MDPSETTRKFVDGRKSPDNMLCYDDTYTPDDDDDDDDDEFLPPAFLQSNKQNDKSTKNEVSSLNKSRDGSESPDLIPVKPYYKFTLDDLCNDHKQQVEHVKQMDEIHEELKNDIKHGGFVNLLNKEETEPDDSFTDEQRNMLKQFEVHETTLQHDWPGVVLFKQENFQCLFSNTVHPTHCGFVSTNEGSRLEKYLESLTVDNYKMTLTSHLHHRLFIKMKNLDKLLCWVFLQMSISMDEDIQNGCKDLIMNILHTQSTDEDITTWTPSFIDVLSVLVNYGASLESLLPSTDIDIESYRNRLLRQPGYVQQHQQQQPANIQHIDIDVRQRQHANINLSSKYWINNLMLVLKVLTKSLNGQIGRYNAKDTSLLIFILCKILLEPSTKTCAYTMEVLQNCLTVVINQYTESDWSKERLKLCYSLCNISQHHHDHSHLAQLLPGGERGFYLQQRYCYLVINTIFTDNLKVSENELDQFEICYLEKFINSIKDLLETDPYTVSSVIRLLDLSVGLSHSSNNTKHKEQLRSLQEKLSRIKVKDSIGMLDRARVKSMIVMITRRWSLDLQTVRRKQRKMFEYTSMDVKIQVETLKQFDTDDDDDDDDDDEDNNPCKIRKLSDNDGDLIDK